MKYLLDTNILLISFSNREKEIRRHTQKIFDNPNNSFCVSTISLLEISQLYRKKTIEGINYDRFDTCEKLLKYICTKIEIIPFEQKHAVISSRINYEKNHNDPFDLAIISQAIGDGLTLISTDKRFPEYEKQGLKIIHNQR